MLLVTPVLQGRCTVFPEVKIFYYSCAKTHVHLSFHCVLKVSVPVSEVVGVEKGRVEILPQKSVEDREKDFTGGFTDSVLT